MKDHLAELVRSARTQDPRNVVREYLQARVLESLQRAGAMIPLAFQGGTALRFLHGIPRYSEDLDFALEAARDRYDLRRWLDAVARDRALEGYDVRFKVSDRRSVHAAFVRFPGLLHELGLSVRREQVIAVKIEIDSRPPGGAVLETTTLRRHVLLRLQHHDRASLLAGKLHALLCRPRLKGRDVFDLAWYLADRDWPAPNLTLLNAALAQTQPAAPSLDASTWRTAVKTRLAGADWNDVLRDVRPFLEPGLDGAIVERDTLLGLLG